jgi:hypothetical protein
MNLTVPESARLEIKFVSYEINFHEILQWLHLHDIGFHEHHSPRIVHNIYFDTPDYETFEINLAGVSSRFKVRYRWYGEELEPDKGTLEIKCRRNNYGWKESFKIKDRIYQPDLTLRQFSSNLIDALPPEGKKWFMNYSLPILLNQYRRRYFVSFDNKLRVTFDTKLAVWDQRFKPYLNIKNKGNMSNIMVMEVKFDPQDKDLASHFMHGLPLRNSRHSKYVSGIFAITSY